MVLTVLLDLVNRWTQWAISTLGYAGLGLVMFLENVFPPIPSEVVLPLAGSLTLQGRFTLTGITLVDALGSSTGALLFYGLGHWLGEERVRRFMDRRGRWLSISAADFDSAKFWFERYGEPVVFFGHMVPMVRSLISIPAGLAGMNLARFTLHCPGHSALEPAVGLDRPRPGAELAPG